MTYEETKAYLIKEYYYLLDEAFENCRGIFDSENSITEEEYKEIMKNNFNQLLNEWF